MTKYSIKNICLGIGIGLIIASVANISATPKALSVDEITREAAKHNLIVIDAKDFIKKQPDNSSGTQTPAPTQPTPTPAQPQTAIVVIKSGMTSENIADVLYANKLIDSKSGFIDRLAALKKESKVQIGTFKIPGGASLDQIIGIITSSPR